LKANWLYALFLKAQKIIMCSSISSLMPNPKYPNSDLLWCFIIQYCFCQERLPILLFFTEKIFFIRILKELAFIFKNRYSVYEKFLWINE